MHQPVTLTIASSSLVYPAISLVRGVTGNTPDFDSGDASFMWVQILPDQPI